MAIKLKQGTAIASLSLTPLIDVVFLLLIFFLVATRFADEDRELDVNLPRASEAVPLVVKPKEIFVNIDVAGNYFLGGQLMPLTKVQEVLEVAKANNPITQSVIIRADKRSELDYSVQVINLCKKIGVEHRLTTMGKSD